jgi:hypothetical protein
VSDGLYLFENASQFHLPKTAIGKNRLMKVQMTPVGGMRSNAYHQQPVPPLMARFFEWLKSYDYGNLGYFDFMPVNLANGTSWDDMARWAPPPPGGFVHMRYIRKYKRTAKTSEVEVRRLQLVRVVCR